MKWPYLVLASFLTFSFAEAAEVLDSRQKTYLSPDVRMGVAALDRNPIFSLGFGIRLRGVEAQNDFFFEPLAISYARTIEGSKLESEWIVGSVAAGKNIGNDSILGLRMNFFVRRTPLKIDSIPAAFLRWDFDPFYSEGQLGADFGSISLGVRLF